MSDHQETEQKSCCQGKENDTEVAYVDPVCGMEVAEGNPALEYTHEGRNYFFCNDHCLKAFSKNPEKYLAPQQERVSNIFSGAKPLYLGLTGTGLLLIIFFGVVTLANGTFASAMQEFQRLWYWVLLLAAGFGFQLGLFFHIKNTIREKMAGATAEVAASGTITTGSMIACCSHGLVNLLPMLGISAAAAFLAQYQQPLILLGVFSNLAGITIMLGIAKKHGVLPHNLLGSLVERWNVLVVRYAIIIIGVVSIMGSTYWSYIK